MPKICGWVRDENGKLVWRCYEAAGIDNFAEEIEWVDDAALSARTPSSERISMEMFGEEAAHGPKSFFDLVTIPEGINEGLSSAKSSTMLQILGMPRDHIDDTCRPANNKPLVELIVEKDVGPFSVTGVKPAVSSLKRIFSKVEEDLPGLYSILGTAGMTCVRYIKGSKKISNHSWGCAIDIRIGDVLDGIQYKGAKTDGKTLRGLVLLSSYFHDEGWYWGVGFSTFEDGMHFEVADETIRKWQSDGKLGKSVSERVVSGPRIAMGDSGLDVKRLQTALAKKGYDIIPDGVFGPITHGILIDFQSTNGLSPTGYLDEDTRSALGL